MLPPSSPYAYLHAVTLYVPMALSRSLPFPWTSTLQQLEILLIYSWDAITHAGLACKFLWYVSLSIYQFPDLALLYLPPSTDKLAGRDVMRVRCLAISSARLRVCVYGVGTRLPYARYGCCTLCTHRMSVVTCGAADIRNAGIHLWSLGRSVGVDRVPLLELGALALCGGTGWAGR